MRTSLIKSTFSAACKDGKNSLTASGAKRYKPIANGNEIKAVYKSDFFTLFIAPLISPFAARGDICGTLAAAKP